MKPWNNRWCTISRSLSSIKICRPMWASTISSKTQMSICRPFISSWMKRIDWTKCRSILMCWRVYVTQPNKHSKLALSSLKPKWRKRSPKPSNHLKMPLSYHCPIDTWTVYITIWRCLIMSLLGRTLLIWVASVWQPCYLKVPAVGALLSPQVS